jgi:hypothetical protein
LPTHGSEGLFELIIGCSLLDLPGARELACDMGGAGVGVGMVAAAVSVVALTWLWAVLLHLVWRPYAAARAFARQGVRGPAYRFFVGNNDEVKAMLAATSGETLDVSCHDFVPRVMPHYRAWTSRYGRVFLSWFGPKPTLCVGDYDMAKRVLSDRSGLYAKPDPGPGIMSLLGMGLVFTEGDDWVRHRSVVHPAFSMDKLKAMTGAIAACATEVIAAWEDRAKAAKGEEVTVEVGHVRNNHVMHMSLCHVGVLVDHECVCELRRVCVRRVGACRTIVKSGREREFVPPQPLVVWS